MRGLLLDEKGELGSVWDLIPGCPQPVSRLPWTWDPEVPIIGVWVWRRRGLVSGLFEYYLLHANSLSSEDPLTLPLTAAEDLPEMRYQDSERFTHCLWLLHLIG